MIRSTLLKLLAPGLILAVAAAQVQAGGCRRARRAARCAPAQACFAAVAPPPAVGSCYGYGPAAPQPGSPAVDDGSFAGWLNAERAARGLAPCGVDPGLCADAATNSSRGFGHSFMGRARRQNVGLGPLPAVCAAWVADPPHAAALFDPSITRVGLAEVNGVTTFSAY